MSGKKRLMALGKAQTDAMFARQLGPSGLDDSEFVPLLESVLTAFESHGLDCAGAEELWEYAYSVYDRLCREDAPQFTFEENRDLMRSFLLGPRRLCKRKKSKGEGCHG
jgi:hypothetical protein